MVLDLNEKLSLAPKSGLFEVVRNITNICNLNCKYCYSNSGKMKQKIFVSLDDAKKIIDMMVDLDVKIVAFTGGDPLLHPNFFEIVELCRPRFKVLFLSTNGFNINAKIAKQIKQSGIDSVQISIDGSEVIHDEIRGFKGSYKKAIESVTLLKNEGIDVALAPTITRQNYDQIQYLYDLSTTLNADISFKRVILTGRGEGINSFGITAKEYHKLYMFANQKNSDQKNKIYAYLHCDPLRFLLYDKKTLQQIKKTGSISGGCMAGVGILYINVNKYIYPCSKLPLFAGDLEKESLTEIWNNSKVLNSLRDRSNIKGKCSNCKYLDVCGGCRASGFEKKGDVFDEDYMCWL